MQVSRLSKFVGMQCIALIQLIAPALVVGYNVRYYGEEGLLMDYTKYRPEHFWLRWRLADGNTILLTRFLGILFNILMHLHSIFSLGAESLVYQKMIILHKKLGLLWKSNSSRTWLKLDALLNCLTHIGICLSITLLVNNTDNPKDLLFDAFALLFLNNLDNLGADLSFIQESEWRGLELAWVYHQLESEYENRNEELPKPDRISWIYTVALLVLYASLIGGLFINIFMDFSQLVIPGTEWTP